MGASVGLLAIPRTCQAQTRLTLAVPSAGMHSLPIPAPFSPRLLQTSVQMSPYQKCFPWWLKHTCLVTLSPYFAYPSSCKSLSLVYIYWFRYCLAHPTRRQVHKNGDWFILVQQFPFLWGFTVCGFSYQVNHGQEADDASSNTLSGQ